MKKSSILVIMMLLLSGLVQAQKAEKAQVKFSGFIGAEAIYDTRDQVTARTGEIILFPKQEIKNAQGEDMTDNGDFFMSTMTARVRATLKPYEVWGGKLTSFIEVDFANRSSKNVHLRLRHAVLKFDKGNTTILAGQFWSPMFVVGVTPNVTSIGAGAPFIGLSRNPQVRITQRFNDKFRASISAMSQLDHSSIGPNGKSEEYMRQAKIPQFDMHLEYGNPKKFTMGLVAGTKTLKPRLKSEKGRKVNEKITSMHGLAYAKLVTANMEYKLQGIYAENSFDMVMLGGYGISNIDPVTGKFDYESLKTTSFWGDMKSKYKSSWNFGLFAGITQNHGADKALSKVFARGANIDKLVRISPRIIYGQKALKLMFEVSQLMAYYGTPNAKYEVENAKSTSSTRLHLTLRYTF